MHELAITKQLVEDIKKLVAERNLKQVQRVVVEIGDKTSYKLDPMKYYFDQLKIQENALRETKFAGSEVNGRSVLLKEIEV